MRFVSIGFRLAAWYFGVAALTLALFTVGAWVGLRHSVLEAVDHDLQLRLRDVRDFTLSQLKAGPNELKDELQEQAMLGLGGGLVQLSEEGVVLYRSTRLGALDLPVTGCAATFTTQGVLRSRVRIACDSVVLAHRRFQIYVAQPLEEFDESIDGFRRILLLLAPVFLLLSSLGGFWISRRALAPVDCIRREARSISVCNLSTRLPLPPAHDELRRLTETLNEMLDRIDSEVKRIVQFTADASHELRTPLTLIQTAAEFSLRRERTREELIDALRKILRESNRTARLVDELLLLARADSGTDDVQLVPVDVTATCRRAYEEARTLADSSNVALSMKLPNAPIYCNGDEQALERLWLILLDNAIKYTNADGRVTFSLTASSSHVEAEVEDTGIGIAAADLAHVFNRFWRADKVRSRNSGGAGLGLSIARWIVERHRGEILLESAPNKGTRVSVRFAACVLPPEITAALASSS